MKPIEAEETGAPVAYCIRAETASEKRFDEAFDRASSEFHSTTVDEYETDRSKTDRSERWVRFKSKLAWPRTTHPQTPTTTMPRTATDEKPEAAGETAKGTAHQELIRRLVQRTEYAHFDDTKDEITEKEARQLLRAQGEPITSEEAKELEALLSTEVGRELANLVEDLTLGIINNAAREALTNT
jgi:hypothetical protein